MQAKMKMIQAMLGEGWQVRRGDVGLLVAVVPGGVVHCVDGRLMKAGYDEETAKRGPKIQGGALGVAYLVAKNRDSKVVDEEVFREACKKIVEAGFVPGVHDMSGEHVHCGYCQLARKDYFADLDLQITPQRMVEVVKEYGGREVKLAGEHEEGVVRVNFREGMTLEPQGEAFGLDGWLAARLGLSEEELLKNAAATVVGLKGPKVVEVIW